MSTPSVWEFPGGKVEHSESDSAALIRELQEELGVTVTVEELVGESRTEQTSIIIHLLGYKCIVQSGTPVATEHQQLKWCSISELLALDWAPADIPIVKGLISVTS